MFPYFAKLNVNILYSTDPLQGTGRDGTGPRKLFSLQDTRTHTFLQSESGHAHAHSERGTATNRSLDGDVQHRSVRGTVLADLEALGLDPEFKLGIDVEHAVAFLLVSLKQGLEDSVVFKQGHGLGLAGIPICTQTPVLKFTEHLRTRSHGTWSRAAGMPAPLPVLVLVVGGCGGSHHVRQTAGFSRCHNKKPLCVHSDATEFGWVLLPNVAQTREQPKQRLPVQAYKSGEGDLHICGI